MSSETISIASSIGLTNGFMTSDSLECLGDRQIQTPKKKKKKGGRMKKRKRTKRKQKGKKKGQKKGKEKRGNFHKRQHSVAQAIHGFKSILRYFLAMWPLAQLTCSWNAHFCYKNKMQILVFRMYGRVFFRMQVATHQQVIRTICIIMTVLTK